jgi:hypothetical protein
MTLRAHPRRPRRGLRTLVVAVAAAAAAIAMIAAPVSATVILREHYANDYGPDSFHNCGFWIDISGHNHGTAHLRVGSGKLESAFFLHDNFAFVETWTRRDTGDFLTVSGNGIFQETHATRVDGNVFTFSSINAGQPFVVRDSSGALVLRDRGVIRETILFDTLGDDKPGGAFIESLSFEVAGPHPGLDFDPCALLG